MDVETSEAIAELGQRIDALERSIRGELGRLRDEFREARHEDRRHTDVQLEAVREHIRIVAEGFATVSTELSQHRAHTDRLFETVRSELRTEMSAVRDDIRTLTTSVAAISAKLESSRG